MCQAQDQVLKIQPASPQPTVQQKESDLVRGVIMVGRGPGSKAALSRWSYPHGGLPKEVLPFKLVPQELAEK